MAALVQETGHLLRSWRTSGGAAGTWAGTQFHASADRWAHDHLCRGLSALDSSIPIVSEEDDSGGATTERRRYWLIDPIDGTASYAHGFSGYVTQVALMDREKPVLAAVFAPEHGELFVAETGSGACRNGIRLPAIRAADMTLVDNTPGPEGLAAVLYAELGFTRYLESGSIGLKICRVAEGSADVFFKTVRVRDWDLAAPELILQEAGGSLVDGHGEAIVYGGAREHRGLVAARDSALASRVVRWSSIR